MNPYDPATPSAPPCRHHSRRHLTFIGTSFLAGAYTPRERPSYRVANRGDDGSAEFCERSFPPRRRGLGTGSRTAVRFLRSHRFAAAPKEKTDFFQNPCHFWGRFAIV
jgi:hypothetical protein